jgi:drug/metabolite transporter (DMT)-like permease
VSAPADQAGRARLWAFVGAVTISSSAVLVRAADVSPSTAAIFRCAYAVPLLALLAWHQRRRAGGAAEGRPRLALAAGCFLAVDLISWHHAIADVGAGLATVLGNAQVAVIPLIAWYVHGERPGRKLAAVLPFSALGVLLVAGIFGGHAYGNHPVGGAAWGAGTAVAYSCFILLLRASTGGRGNTVTSLLIATATAAVAATLLGLLGGDARLTPTWPSAGWLLLLAVSSQVVGWIMITYSLPLLPAAMTSLALTIQPVGALILAALFFSESPDELQLLGSALILSCLIVTTYQPRRSRQRHLRGLSATAEPAAADVEDRAARPVAGGAE